MNIKTRLLTDNLSSRSNECLIIKLPKAVGKRSFDGLRPQAQKKDPECVCQCQCDGQTILL